MSAVDLKIIEADVRNKVAGYDDITKLIAEVRRLQQRADDENHRADYNETFGLATVELVEAERDKLKAEVVGLQESLAECALYTRQILGSEKLSDRVRRRLRNGIEIARAALSPAETERVDPESSEPVGDR